ncbi:MAG: DNA-binding protein [Burkholderiaceae bacterium]
MDTTDQNEKTLLADIDELRNRFPQTQDLYREVCVAMFFRYGMTPTANKLYQLVRKGSMSAPAAALNKFWEDLRKKSRVRIEHPDLPEALKTAAGELTVALWSTAQTMAQETLISYRTNAQAAVDEAKAELESAQTERDACKVQFEDAIQAIDESHLRISALEQNLVAMAATNISLQLQLQQAKDNNSIHLQELQDKRREFTAELDKLRSSSQLAEERFRAAETRALLEIDRERTAVVKLQKELDAIRASASKAAERDRSEVAALQAQLGDHRQKTGILEGNLQVVTANWDLATSELKTIQKQLADAAAQAYLMHTEVENWRRQAEESQRMVVELRKSVKPKRISRQPQTS